MTTKNISRISFLVVLFAASSLTVASAQGVELRPSMEGGRADLMPGAAQVDPAAAVAPQAPYDGGSSLSSPRQQPVGAAPAKSKHKQKQQKAAKTKHHHSVVGDTLRAPGEATKASVGLVDETAKVSIGVTGKAAKTVVGVPGKAVKEVFKALF